MAEVTTPVQGKRKTKVGRVVSDKMDKTIVVSVERLARHRLYKRVIRLTTKFKAHDEANGLSYSEEEAVSVAIHAAAHPGRRHADEASADEDGQAAEASEGESGSDEETGA